jgi:pimeloyl-ACP methyl ester carboxylesterase
MAIQILEEHLRPARHLVVAFTGIQHGLGGIPFEFHKSLPHLDCAPMFVRDAGQRWYQYEDACLAEVVRRIEAARASTGAATVTCLGNSMGGFGAMLFGSLCRADAILAFVPQTTISPAAMAALGDRRYDEWTRHIPAYYRDDLLAFGRPTASITICLGDGEPLDTAHAARLSDWNCTIVRVEKSGHDVAATLKERSQLMPLISRAIGGARGCAAP